MTTSHGEPQMVDLLNQAIGRELQVCIQYMFQHSIGAIREVGIVGKTPAARRSQFVATHRAIYWPGNSLKKIAITEMRHAEAIAERVALLGGEPATQPDSITITGSIQSMLENDRDQEQSAIELYRRIIDVAASQGDKETQRLFQQILSDEESHHRAFFELLKTL